MTIETGTAAFVVDILDSQMVGAWLFDCQVKQKQVVATILYIFFKNISLLFIFAWTSIKGTNNLFLPFWYNSEN